MDAAALAGARGSADGVLDHAMVLVVRAWMREHLAEPIYLDDLAAVAGMDRFRLSRVFARVVGRSPMRFVGESIDGARSLLLNSAMPLREIAPQVGLSDEFQLSRVFSEVIGHAPRTLRRARS